MRRGMTWAGDGRAKVREAYFLRWSFLEVSSRSVRIPGQESGPTSCDLKAGAEDRKCVTFTWTNRMYTAIVLPLSIHIFSTKEQSIYSISMYWVGC